MINFFVFLFIFFFFFEQAVFGLGNILVPVVIFSFNVVLLNEPGIHVSARHFLFIVSQQSVRGLLVNIFLDVAKLELTAILGCFDYFSYQV